MKTCAFTGHRPQNLPFGFNEEDERCVNLKKNLREQIINLIENEGVTHFMRTPLCKISSTGEIEQRFRLN